SILHGRNLLRLGPVKPTVIDLNVFPVTFDELGHGEVRFTFLAGFRPRGAAFVENLDDALVRGQTFFRVERAGQENALAQRAAVVGDDRLAGPFVKVIGRRGPCSGHRYVPKTWNTAKYCEIAVTKDLEPHFR